MLRSLAATLAVVVLLDAAAVLFLTRGIEYEPFAFGRMQTEVPADWDRAASEDSGEEGVRVRFEKRDVDGAWLELAWTPEKGTFEEVADRLETRLHRAAFQRDLDVFGPGKVFVFEKAGEGERIRYTALFLAPAMKRLYRVELATRLTAQEKYLEAFLRAVARLRLGDLAPHPGLERELEAIRDDLTPAYAQPASRWIMGGLAVPFAFLIPMWIVWMTAGGRPDIAELRGEKAEREELGVRIKVKGPRGSRDYLGAVYLTDQFFRAFTSGRPLFNFPLYYPGERTIAAEKLGGSRWLRVRLEEFKETDHWFHVSDPDAWAADLERRFRELGGLRRRVAEEVSRDVREMSVVDRVYERPAEPSPFAAKAAPRPASTVVAGLAQSAPAPARKEEPAPVPARPEEIARLKPAAPESAQHSRRVLAALLDEEAPPASAEPSVGGAEDWLAAVAREKGVAVPAPAPAPEPEVEEEESAVPPARATEPPRPASEPEIEEIAIDEEELPSPPPVRAEPEAWTPPPAPAPEPPAPAFVEPPPPAVFEAPAPRAPEEPRAASFSEFLARRAPFPSEPALEEVVAGAASRALRAAAAPPPEPPEPPAPPAKAAPREGARKDARGAFGLGEVVPAEAKRAPDLEEAERADIDDFEIPGRE